MHTAVLPLAAPPAPPRPSECFPVGLAPEVRADSPAHTALRSPSLLTLVPDLLTYITSTAHLTVAQARSLVTVASRVQGGLLCNLPQTPV